MSLVDASVHRKRNVGEERIALPDTGNVLSEKRATFETSELHVCQFDGQEANKSREIHLTSQKMECIK